MDRTCEGLTRRQLLKVGAVSFLGLGLTEFLALKAGADAPQRPKSKGATRDVSVILLWDGGRAESCGHLRSQAQRAGDDPRTV
jgi:hypothetical protein